MKQVADSADLLSRIGDEIAGDDLVALGAEHGWEFSIENLQAAAEWSDAELEGVAGGFSLGAGPAHGSVRFLAGDRDSLITKPGQGTGA